MKRLLGRGPNELWAGTMMGTVARWDGTAWQVADRLTYPLSDLAAVGDEVWALAGDGVSRHGPAGFEVVPGVPAEWGEWCSRAWGLRPDDVWVQCDGAGAQRVVHYDGQQWRQRAENLIPQWGISPNDAWAVRDGSLFHWDGVSWQEHPAVGVTAVWGLSSTQAWAVGKYETLLEWDGASWKVLTSRGPCDYRDCATFNGVWGTGPRELWLVGENGPGWGGSAYGTIQRWDGQALTAYLRYAARPRQWNESNEIGPLRDVFGFATGDVYATDGYQLLHLAE